MFINGDILELDIEIDYDEVKALHACIKDKLSYIKEIILLKTSNGMPSSSAIFTLLSSVKHSKPTI